jgi:hypothetical protein
MKVIESPTNEITAAIDGACEPCYAAILRLELPILATAHRLDVAERRLVFMFAAVA